VEKKKLLWILIVLMVVLVATPLGIVFLQKGMEASEEQKKLDEMNRTTFASYSEYEIFQEIPLLTGKNIRYEQAEDFGGDNYGIDTYDTTFEEYQAYLILLEQEGFVKYVDNGKEGLEGYVYTAHYTKDDLLVVVTHFTNSNQTMVTVSDKVMLSEHLFYDESYVADNMPNAKTTFHLQELYFTGNSFIFQLKNGHFILNDGGQPTELPYLLDYLESLVPEGEKPIVDAWFITHSHLDHIGVFQEFMNTREYIDRICVENVYFTEVNKVTWKLFRDFDNPQSSEAYARTVPKLLKNSEGVAPNVYRCRTGERYYFNDITIDVVYSHDLRPAEKWYTFNGASTWLMYTIEGQKVFLTADGEWDNMETIMSIYDKEYFDLAFYQTPHHGSSIWDEFTDYLSHIGTVIVPDSDVTTGGAGGVKLQNEYLRSQADESYSYGDGTVVFTFPYKVGTAKVLPLTEWKYDAEPPARFKNK
jgi:hypothetical protein